MYIFSELILVTVDRYSPMIDKVSKLLKFTNMIQKYHFHMLKYFQQYFRIEKNGQNIRKFFN